MKRQINSTNRIPGFANPMFYKPFILIGIFLASCLLELASSTDSGSVQVERNEPVKRNLEMGNQLVQQGQFREAIPYYKRVIEQTEKFSPVYNLLGFCYTQLNELQLANQYFRKAVQLSPGSVEARINLGANYSALSQPQNAIGQFEEVLRRDPRNVSALYNLGIAQGGLKQWSKAAQNLEQASLLSPSDLQISIHLLEAQMKSGKARSALRLVDRIVPQIERDPRLQFTVGVTLAQNGMAERGRLLIRSAHKLLPEVAEWIIALANEHYNKQQYQTTVDLLESLERNKVEDSAVWHDMLGYAFYKLDRLEEAIDELQKAIRLDPRNEEYYLDLGEVFGANRAYYAAVTLFESAIKMRPNSDKLEYALALSHQLAGNRKKCGDILQELLKRNPHFEAGYKVLAESFDAGGEWDKVLKIAQELQRLSKENYWGWYLEAKARYEMGRASGMGLGEAEESIERAIQLRSSEPESYYLLGKIKFHQGLYPETVTLLRKVIDIQSDHAPAHYLLADAYKRIGQIDLSQKQFEIHERLKKEEKNRTYRGLIVSIDR